MDAQQKDTIDNLLTSLMAVNYKSLTKEVYEKKGGMEAIQIRGLSLKEIGEFLRRALNQLSKEMEKNWVFIPYLSVDANYTLGDKLNIMKAHLQAGNEFEYWIDELVWLIQFERRNGIWDNPELSVKRELGSLKGEIGPLVTKAKNAAKEFEGLNSQVLGHLRDVETIHNNYQAVKGDFEFNQQEAVQTIQNLRQLQRDLDRADGEVSSLLNVLSERTNAANTTLDQERERFNQLVADISQVQQGFVVNNNLLDQTLTEFNTVLTNARQETSHILDQRDAIAELRGFAADGTLGGVFDRRRRQLTITVALWAIGSIFVAFVAGNWILQVVHDYPITDDNVVINWGGVLANVIRSFPMVLLVFFCLAQYTKERNVQEEYAFKAAVSMTITAYAAMIGADEARTKMLIATVQGVYTPPVLGKPLRPFSFRTKDIAEMSKNLLEATKNAQSTVSDALKAKKSTDDEKSEK